MTKFSGKRGGVRLALLFAALFLTTASCASSAKADKDFPKTVVKPTKSEEVFIPVPTPKPEPVAVVPEEKPFAVKFRESGKGIIEDEKTEEFFSLNFREISLEAVINMLSDGGKNFRYIIHPDVGDRKVLGVILENVTWREALDVILKIHNLVMVDEKGLVVINTYENYEKELAREDEKLKRKQDKAEKERSILVDTLKSKKMVAEEAKGFRSFRLRYTRPDTVLSYLSNIYGGETKQSSSSSSDSSSEESSTGLETESGIKFSTFPQLSLITVFGTASQLDEVAGQIEVVDAPIKQVFIESRIVEISREYSRSLGIQWGGTADGGFGGNGVAGTYEITGSSSGDSGLSGTGVDFSASDGSGGGNSPAAMSISLNDIVGTTILNARLSALETQGKSKTLSNPKITTVNGSKATIEKGWEIPYQTTSSDTGDATVEFKNAVISLEVTPSITPDNMINMQILAKKDDPDFTNQLSGGVPLITRSIETNVFVADGGTAVLGGVFENVQADTEAGVPFLSDIPVLGWLFKNTNKTDDEKELLIFITPTIVKGDFS